jgi:Xaa-Pro aminopeptidase
MRYQPVHNNFFVRNRKKLKKQINKPGVLAVVNANDEMPRNGDVVFPFRQNSDLFYLTGIEQEKTIFIMCPQYPGSVYDEVLFISRHDKQQEIWEGKKLSLSEAQNISGIEKVMFLDEFDKVFDKLMQYAQQVYLNMNEHPRLCTEVLSRGLRFKNYAQGQYPGHSFEPLLPLMATLRMIKEPEEIEFIQKACDITGEAFRAVLSHIKPGMPAYEIEAEMTRVFISNGANGHAYSPIIASGKNACTLHYIKNENICRHGELLLLDFGAEYANYAADCSRTIPVNKTYTARQRDLYMAVLRIMQKAMPLFVAGTTIKRIQQQVLDFCQEEHINLGLYSESDLKNQNEAHQLVKRYFMHGVSHFIGLDVHDAGSKEELLKPGMVLSCEPGIYIPEEGVGIRIEDTIMVTGDKPYNFMATIPVMPDDIEQA